MAVLPPESPASDIKIYTRIEPFAQHGARHEMPQCRVTRLFPIRLTEEVAPLTF